jgi:hypothetical protein
VVNTYGDIDNEPGDTTEARVVTQLYMSHNYPKARSR